jgi:ABC-type molybdate transport system substrate-binding protein
MKTQPSWIAATAKIADGATSSWLISIEWSKLSKVSLTPLISYEKRSVLAVHKIITVLS